VVRHGARVGNGAGCLSAGRGAVAEHTLRQNKELLVLLGLPVTTASVSWSATSPATSRTFVFPFPSSILRFVLVH
jgi:hypothetical protein